MTTLVLFTLIFTATAAARTHLPARPKWMSPFAYAVARCETQVNYRHHAGPYEGAWGWYHSTWMLDRPRGAPEHAYDASPRDQYRAFLKGYYRLHHYWGCIANKGYRYWL